MTHHYYTVESLLREIIGLDVSAASSSIQRAIGSRLAATGLKNEADYLRRIEVDSAELTALIDAVVVSETWFFRDREPFEYLKTWATAKWRGGHANTCLRILSIPCATGEEPYSIAIALLEAGFGETEFIVDAVDVSGRALDFARRGIYGRNSLREKNRFISSRYLVETGAGYEVQTQVRRRVRFHQQDAGTYTSGLAANCYHAIFCRNLLIYMSGEARSQLIGELHRVLEPGCILFLGHAETPHSFVPSYTPVPHPRTFAARKPLAPPAPVPGAAPARPAPASGSGSVTKPHYEKSVATAKKPRRVPLPPMPPVDDVSALLKSARQLADQGLLAEAASRCWTILERDITCADAYFLLGIIAQASGSDADAQDHFQKVLYLDPNHADARAHLSLVMAEEGRRG